MSKKVIRRTKEEIKAGFPHELKIAGVEFKDWKKEQKVSKSSKLTKKENKPVVGNLRRTKEEKAAGFPLEFKRAGKSFEEWKKELNGREKKSAPKIVTAKEKPSLDNFKEGSTEYVKIIEKIIVETKENKKELKDIIMQSLEKCNWEWKRVALDDKFKVSNLDKLGKDGWKFAFIYDNSTLRPNSKKPDIICFQRPVLKK